MIIAQIARRDGLTVTWTEGANHTKVRMGKRVTMIPRHREIKESLARAIIRDLQEDPT